MKNCHQFYVNGRWYTPEIYTNREFTDPTSGALSGLVGLGSADDVDMAVAAAKRAAATFSRTGRNQRIDMLRRIVESYRLRSDDLAQTMSLELGISHTATRQAQVGVAEAHFIAAMEALEEAPTDDTASGSSGEAAGVFAFVTNCNWPINLIVSKLAPALAAGCTIVWKPSEASPYSATILMEVLHDAKVPAGVVNMIFGEGAYVGRALSSHPDVDMVSIAATELDATGHQII